MRWRWSSCLFKTRTLATYASDGGNGTDNGSKGKASRNVEIGALIGIRAGWDEKVVEIKAISEQRRGAPEAQLLYEETPASIEKREKRALENKSYGGRIMSDHKPNKKERRDIKQLKQDIFGGME